MLLFLLLIISECASTNNEGQAGQMPADPSPLDAQPMILHNTAILDRSLTHHLFKVLLG